MSFLDNFRNSQKDSAATGWQNLDSTAGLQAIIEQSSTKPAIIFKHSTRCGISVGAKSRLETWNIDSEQVSFHYLDLLENRDISNKIAEELGVVHQSPQIILVKDGKAIWSTTHHAIAPEPIKEALKNA